jgi:hypothetical protein
MGGTSASIAGRSVTLAAAAQAVVCARDATLLGFFSSVSQAVAINDAATLAAAAAGNQVLNASACAVGWNPLPLAMNNGIVATPGTGNITFVFA